MSELKAPTPYEGPVFARFSRHFCAQELKKPGTAGVLELQMLVQFG
jgi:hypothetical protein